MNALDPDGRWPSYVYSRGNEPDPRFTLANERTFLAWIRTALALLAGAAALHAFDLDLSEAVTRGGSILLALAGMLGAVQAWTGWARTERALRESRPLPSNGSRPALALAVAVVAIALVVAGVWQ